MSTKKQVYNSVFHIVANALLNPPKVGKVQFRSEF